MLSFIWRWKRFNYYTDGTIEPLTADKVIITNGGNDIAFTGLDGINKSCTVNCTLKKVEPNLDQKIMLEV